MKARNRDGDLTVADVARITGISPTRAYKLRYHGEYLVGGKRYVRREEFELCRNTGKDICRGEA